jgi:CBS domain-containing protein
MGEQKVNIQESDEKKTEFIRHLLDDVKALEYMLEHQLFEKGITRIGAEQEFCLVTEDWRPAKNSIGILEDINDPHFTTELACFNLEINLDPVELKDNCLSKIQQQLQELLKKASIAAEKNDSKIVLAGILPTISKAHLNFDYITPMPRYYALNQKLMALRMNHFHLYLLGVDELNISHDSILFEACNTSFQLHLQIEPNDFISSFNWAQAISGPVLGICANSPLLFGRELWNESRIALFRQSVDTRNISSALKDEAPRVAFGSDWATGSPASIYKDDISQHKVILSRDLTQNSLEMVQQGKIPKLEALTLHSGTIYPWNRACYGVGNGKPHLRIENRYIPSGPSILDEMANFAFWVGLMSGRPKKYDNMSKVMDFKDAKSNFIKAARTGKNSILIWDDKEYTIKELIKNVMLPIAHSGLTKVGVAKADIKRLLAIIEERLTGITGAQWIISNYRKMRETETIDNSLRLVTKATYKNQKTNKTVSEWAPIDESESLKHSSNQIGQIMSTRVLTAIDTDLAAMATSIMQWKNIHHVPVQNKAGELCGLLTWTHVQNLKEGSTNKSILVKDIMAKDVISITASKSIKEAIVIMKEKEIGCLPVIQEKELVGIVTTKDVIAFNHD